ncbi:MAG: trans-4-hydroxy-L-proline dehydratase [Verrucomicrobiota bacterium]|jgi:formate C-acetyltransferase
MTPRTEKLRQESLSARPAISHERAVLLTEYYQANEGRESVAVTRAKSFLHLCEHKTVYIGEGELIVGERGPGPKQTPTFPELTCHSVEDLKVLNCRAKTHYDVGAETLRVYEEKIIPYWRGRSMRDKMFAQLPAEWHEAYGAGLFTEFMEQRAPGHTVLDGKIYGKGMVDFKRDIAEAMAALDFLHDAEAYNKREALRSFDISCDAVIRLAERHAELARKMAGSERKAARRAELEKIAEVCGRVPAQAPRNFQEALQYYWFCHLAVITELNGWDSFSPGHLDQHLLPFYKKGLAEGTLSEESGRELLECFFIKFNNHPAPPKVGVTLAESGTYTDFANLNLGGLLADGAEGSNEVSHLLLDIVEEMHLLQPSSNIQLSRKSPDAFLKHALRVLRHGYGFPSIFNADAVVLEQLRQGKKLEDARAGGCSGCVEVGAFGKEAYILTGYFNLVKVLEITLHNGVDPMTGRQIGLRTGEADTFQTFPALFGGWRQQLRHFLEIKLRGNQMIERMFAQLMPAPFLSVLTDDCVKRGLDYNAGGARYNNTYVQFVGLGSLTDSLSALRQFCFDSGNGDGAAGRKGKRAPAGSRLGLRELTGILDADFAGHEVLRQRLVNRTHKYGNDDDAADDITVEIFNTCFEELDGRPNTKGGHYRIEMLPTTCHVYFGSLIGATPDGRRARRPLSEGISPAQGADRRGPTAVFKSAGKMDHLKAGGTLLNMKLTPALVAAEEGLEQWAQLVRSYFKMDGHHVQFNVVRAEDLRKAQQNPEEHRDLIIRVAGYSDYFCDISTELQEEIIARTEHESF